MTEQNTLPIINKDVQLTFLSQIIRDVYDTYVLLCSLDFQNNLKGNYEIINS